MSKIKFNSIDQILQFLTNLKALFMPCYWSGINLKKYILDVIIRFVFTKTLVHKSPNIFATNLSKYKEEVANCPVQYNWNMSFKQS